MQPWHQKQDLRNGYCSRVGGKVRGWAKLCTLYLMGNTLVISYRSFADLACYHSSRNGICTLHHYKLFVKCKNYMVVLSNLVTLAALLSHASLNNISKMYPSP